MLVGGQMSRKGTLLIGCKTLRVDWADWSYVIAWTSITPISSLTNTTASSLTLALASRWLTTCLTEHAQCVSSNDTGWVPTRLIDVGIPSSDMTLSLCDRSQVHPGRRYTTLSHRWGSCPTLQLVTDNITSFRTSIEMNILPKTYADAIVITRALGIRYIWIDSLCIIQDSREDWIRECGMMSQVYKHSTCNIAAIDALDSHGGCFFQRDPMDILPVIVRSEWSNVDNDDYLIAKDRDSWTGNVVQRSLFTRGWVIQEQILSSRTLHFGRRQVYWECIEHRASESCATGLRDGDEQMPQQKIRHLREPPGIGALYDFWLGTIFHYSRAHLTKSSDKLVAISGVAKELKKMYDEVGSTNVEYMAGLWSTTLAHELVWIRGSTGGRLRSDEYRAPSWSWASLDGAVTYVGKAPDSLVLIDILDHRTVPVHEDPYLMIKDGFVRVRGWMWKLKSSHFWQIRNLVKIRLHPARNGLGADHFKVQLDEPTIRDHELFLLPVRVGTSGLSRMGSLKKDKYGEYIDNIQGLMLKPDLTPSDPGRFTRAGFFEMGITSLVQRRFDLDSLYFVRERLPDRVWDIILGNIQQQLKENDMMDNIRECEFEERPQILDDPWATLVRYVIKII